MGAVSVPTETREDVGLIERRERPECRDSEIPEHGSEIGTTEPFDRQRPEECDGLLVRHDDAPSCGLRGDKHPISDADPKTPTKKPFTPRPLTAKRTERIGDRHRECLLSTEV